MPGRGAEMPRMGMVAIATSVAAGIKEKMDRFMGMCLASVGTAY